MHTEIVTVEGMSCGHCANAVEGALKEIGISGKVDLEAKTVKVEFDKGKVGLDTIKKAIEEQGYTIG